LFLAALYITRLDQLFPCCIYRRNLYRLFTYALLAATKYHDEYLPEAINALYHGIAGLKGTNYSFLEVQFLVRINFELFVTVEEYATLCHILSQSILHRGDECHCVTSVLKSLACVMEHDIDNGKVCDENIVHKLSKINKPNTILKVRSDEEEADLGQIVEMIYTIEISENKIESFIDPHEDLHPLLRL